MIRKDTAVQIVYAYRDIEAGEELLKKIREDRRWEKDHVDLRDAFGRPRNLQLGIPSGESGHRLYDVSWELAVPVIEAHIAKMRARLVELAGIARMEIDGTRPEPDAAPVELSIEELARL